MRWLTIIVLGLGLVACGQNDSGAQKEARPAPSDLPAKQKTTEKIDNTLVFQPKTPDTVAHNYLWAPKTQTWATGPIKDIFSSAVRPLNDLSGIKFRNQLNFDILADKKVGPLGDIKLDKPPNLNDIKALQPVFFATDRIVTGEKLQLASITNQRNHAGMLYGLAVVSVPKNHTIGRVERPQPFLGFLWVRAETDIDDFRVQQLFNLSRADFVKELGGNADSVLLFVHGYNQSFSDAVFKAAQIAYDANFAGSVVVFSWPSAGALFGYDHDNASADFAVGDLLELFRILTDEIGKKKLFIVAHSLGNRIIVNALQRAADAKLKLNISELVMAAPDVDTDVFMKMAKQIKAVAGNITLYASKADKALLASGKKAWGTRMGYIGDNGPNLVDGVEIIDVTTVGDDMFGLNHSTFSANMAVLNDLGKIIMAQSHEKPNIRSPILRDMPNKQHTKYWMFPR